MALFLRADKQKENEKLRESLSRKTANLEHLQREFACVWGENERLQRELESSAEKAGRIEKVAWLGPRRGRGTKAGQGDLKGAIQGGAEESES